MDLISIYKFLPNDIVDIIMEYANYKLRNGKYIRQLDKNLSIFRLISNIELIKNGSIELFVKYVKRKYYCIHKIKISYQEEYNGYCIKEALDELDYDNSEHEICIYNTYWYSIIK